MKKTLYIGMIAQIVLTAFIFLSIMNQLQLNTILYRNQSKITILEAERESNLVLEEQAQLLLDAAEKYKVTVNKYIFTDDNDLSIYTTDVTLKDHIRFRESTENQQAEYLSQKDFVWNDAGLTMKIISMDAFARTGISGVYYISATSSNDREQFLEELRTHIGEVEYSASNDYYYRVFSDILGNYLVLIVWVILFLINLSVLIQYLMRSSTKLAVLKSFGWKNREVLGSFIAPLLKIGSLLIGVIFILTYGYYYLKDGGFISAAPYFIVLVSAFMLLIFMYTIVHWGFLHSKACRQVNSIKGQNFSNLGIIFNLFSRICVSLAIILIGLNVIELKKTIEDYQKQDAYWEKTRSVYAVELRYITNNMEKYRPYEKNLKAFFEKAEAEQGLFLVDASNYERLSNNEFIYRANTSDPVEEIASPNGRSMTINANYLTHNPIYKSDHTLVSTEDFVYEQDTRNLLVPEKFREYEEAIRMYHTEGFEFQKYIFNELPEETEEVVPLKINIVYVKDTQKYFTYNPQIDSKDFSIIDPITIVDTGNIDATFYASWLTSQAFVKSEATDGYSFILPSVIATNTLPNIQNTIAIYNFRAEEINQKKYLLQTLLVMLGVLIIVLIGNIYFSNHLIIEKNKYGMYIKKISGYRYLELIAPLLAIQLILNGLVTVVVLLTNYSETTVVLIGIWLFFDLLITTVSLIHTRKLITIFELSKKGEQV